MFETRSMRICVIAGCLLGAAVGEIAAAGPSLRTVVKTDPRSGCLVRRTDVAPAPGTTRKDALESLGLSRAAIDALARRLANEYGVEPALVQAVIQAESNYDPFAVSPKGAQGLMQLMPGTARSLSVRNSFHPEQNIEAGVRHLRDLLNRFGGRVPEALAAYNAGAGAVLKYGGVPPYPETAGYVAKIGRKLAASKRDAPAAAGESAQRIEQFVDASGTLHVRTVSAP
jgi:soluble lytic murein transglycosylase-like protein